MEIRTQILFFEFQLPIARSLFQLRISKPSSARIVGRFQLIKLVLDFLHPGFRCLQLVFKIHELFFSNGQGGFLRLRDRGRAAPAGALCGSDPATDGRCGFEFPAGAGAIAVHQDGKLLQVLLKHVGFFQDRGRIGSGLADGILGLFQFALHNL